ncbi:MAG: hypothetical protein KA314_02285 [Chloroflexi bacterium]|nr:hypothetical protein [Chloroflexota bacterium]MBP8054637.1 hypothetical protein [Chloroflexota bacterium]
MRRILIIVSLVGPAIFLAILALFPELDVAIHQPLFHFYIVTFFTFAAAVTSLFIVNTIHQQGLPRFRLLPTAFAAMGSIFFIHGVLTPGAIIFTNNPGIRWASWLTLFVGGLIFLAASFDPDPPQVRWLNRFLFGGITLFILIVIFVPHWLTAIDENVSPFHFRLAFISTLMAWAMALIRLGRRWWQQSEPLDGVMTLIAAWQLYGTLSLHLFTLWHISWWLYHIELLLGVFLATWVMVQRYENLRQFRLTPYFALTSLIITAAVALLASHLFSQFVERELVRSLEAQVRQSGENLAMAVIHDLPEPVTEESLRAAADGAVDLNQIIWQQLTGLTVEYVNIYDGDGQSLLENRSMPLTPAEADLINQALVGQADVAVINFADEETHTEHTLTPGPHLRTYVPLLVEGLTDPVGVLLLQQPVPELNPTVTRARLQGLFIGMASMGLLFLSSLIIIRRADQVISNRTNELAEANTHLHAAELARDELTNMIVHDLRNPLTTVIMGLDWLQKVGNEPERLESRHRFLNSARVAADRLVTMINDLLDVTRLEAGRLQPHYTPTDIMELLQNRAAAYTPLVESDNKRIAVQANGRLPIISTDIALLERVLDNLIGNALKYTHSGGHITLMAHRQPGQILISVADDGEGVPLAFQSRIFDKFVQVTNQSGQPIRKGTGLGLTFCRLVVEAHGGKIWVESEPEQGSIFYFTLPFPS